VKFTINNNGQKSDQIQNDNIIGFSFTFTNTAAESSAFNPETVQVNATLYRDGAEIVNPVSGNVYALALATGFQTEEGVASGNYTSYTVTLPGIINLDGSDKLDVTVTVAGSTTYDCTVESISGCGIEWFTPLLNIYYRPNSGTNTSFNFGSNVTAITILNTGTAHAITQFAVKSNEWSATGLTVTSFMARIQSQWQRVVTRYQFDVYRFPECPLSNCSANVTFDPAITNNVYIVCASGVTSAPQLKKAMSLQGKIARKLYATYGVR